MKNTIYKIGIVFIAVMLFATSCDDTLTDLNKNPNAANLEDGNVNLMMPAVLGPTATRYLELGVNDMAGAMQHTQKSGWAGGHNYYEWGGTGWEGYYDVLRTNDLLIKNAQENGFTFHEGVGLTIRAFIFGQIADYWGDAPYEEALQADEGIRFPTYSSQEAIYNGVIADLQAAAALFATGDETNIDGSVDLYFSGNMAAWEKFANSLLIRYAVRISEKNSSVQSIVESVVASGNFISSSSEDATMDYTGGSNDQWPIQYDDEQSSTRYHACATLIDQLVATNDPRISIWFDPVRVQWVADGSVTGAEDSMRVNGGPLVPILPNWNDYRGSTDSYTRPFNPADVTYDDGQYIGVPAGIFMPDVQNFNGNPSPGQGRHNVHVSMLGETFIDGQASEGDLLQSRLVSAAEMHFTLAEMAVNNWSVGDDAETHYNAGILASLEAWGIESEYATFITEVPFNSAGSDAEKIEQIITQKWVASFSAAAEAWNDYKRTGFPVLSVGSGAAQPVPAIRFGYGGDELNNNTDNVSSAVESSLEITGFSGQLGKDSPYSKQWLLQGTGKPY